MLPAIAGGVQLQHGELRVRRGDKYMNFLVVATTPGMPRQHQIGNMLL
jgi:hypothetical protein